MILMPTRNRPKSLLRFIENYNKTRATLPVCVIIDSNDKSYDDITLPAHWIRFINPANHHLRDAMNNAFSAYPNEPFYGVVADDLIPMTPEWDVKLAEAAGKHNIAWPDDTIQGERLPTHPFIGGDLVRAWGWFASPATTRHCSDFIWLDFANALGVGKYCPHIIMSHRHWQAGTAPFDSTYAIQPSASIGHSEYWDKYHGTEIFKSEVKMVKEKLGL